MKLLEEERHLRVFRCVSYIRVRDSNSEIWDLKVAKCQFTGYNSDEMDIDSGMSRRWSEVAIHF